MRSTTRVRSASNRRSHCSLTPTCSTTSALKTRRIASTPRGDGSGNARARLDAPLSRRHLLVHVVVVAAVLQISASSDRAVGDSDLDTRRAQPFDAVLIGRVVVA